MNVTVRSAGPDDRAEWLRMRKSLWEDCPDDQQVREMEEILTSDTEEVFFAERPEGVLCGFLEAALRSRADGCDSTPVGYIEGWYVDQDMRRGVSAGRWSRRRRRGHDRGHANRWPPTPSYGTPSATRLTGRWATRRRPESFFSRKT